MRREEVSSARLILPIRRARYLHKVSSQKDHIYLVSLSSRRRATSLAQSCSSSSHTCRLTSAYIQVVILYYVRGRMGSTTLNPGTGNDLVSICDNIIAFQWCIRNIYML